MASAWHWVRAAAGSGYDPSQSVIADTARACDWNSCGVLGVRLVKSQLYDLTTGSSGALLVAVGTLLAAACVAGVIPARKAASVDKMRALRTE